MSKQAAFALLDSFAFQAPRVPKRPLPSPELQRRTAVRVSAGVASFDGDAGQPLLPFLAATGGGFRERYASVSARAFKDRVPCTEHVERPLRLLIVGHNPSDHSWESGVPYSNPSNRYWPLLRESGVIPASWRAAEEPAALCNNMPAELGIGITDVLLEPSSDAQAFGRERMLKARDEFFRRLRGHVARAGAPPRIVAFVGIRQWAQLFQPPLKNVPGVLQPASARPPDWPLPDDCQVFVLTSPSGRVVIPHAARLAEYQQLASALHGLPWPL